MRKYLSFILLLIGLTLQAQETYKTVKDISYIPAGETDGYRKERCKLDVYYPVGKKDFPTIVWFHGGGLEGGGKHVPEMFMNQGFAVVAVNYRLSPKAQNPAYTEDAAAAVAWAYKHIEEYGGSPRRVFDDRLVSWRWIGGRRKACSRDVYESGICSRRCQLPPES